MSLPVIVNPSTSIATGITNAGEADSTITLDATKMYLFVADQDCYLTQAAVTPAAAKASGSFFVSKGTERLLKGSAGVKVSILGSAAGGFAFIAECTVA